MNLRETKNQEANLGSQEISLFDAFIFLKKYRNIIALGGFFGLMIAVLYVLLTPMRYEAFAQVRLAQLIFGGIQNPMGLSPEDPVTLISRVKIPSNYDSHLIQVCGNEDSKNPALEFSKDLKIYSPKGLQNIVEFRVYGKSPEAAKACAQALFELIIKLQAERVKPFVEAAAERLKEDDRRIESIRRFLSNADKYGGAMPAAYLSAKDEINYYLIDREKADQLIKSSQQLGVSVTSPIYVPKTPYSPSVPLSLGLGFLFGIVLALMTSLTLQYRLKN